MEKDHLDFIIHKYKILHQPFPPACCCLETAKTKSSRRENTPTNELLFLCRQNSDLGGIDKGFFLLNMIVLEWEEITLKRS